MALTGTVSGQTYYKIIVADAIGESWNISPFDINGNAVDDMLIICDTKIGNLTLNLPPISSLKSVSNTKITIVNLTAVNATQVIADILTPDTIGSSTNMILTLAGETVELNAASESVWYGVQTA